MPPDALQRKVREAAEKARETPANFSKEHIVVTYSFGGRQGQRVLRCEGTDEFGSSLYYDYRTGATRTLEALGKYWGATGVQETHKADLANLRAIRTGGGAAPDGQLVRPGGQQGIPADSSGAHRGHNRAPADSLHMQGHAPADSSHSRAPAPPGTGTRRSRIPSGTVPRHVDPSQAGNLPGQGQPPPMQAQNAPGRRAHAGQHTNAPQQQQSVQLPPHPSAQRQKKDKADAPITAPDIFKVPDAPPQGRPASAHGHSAMSNLLFEEQPFFTSYLKVYYADGPMRCASGAWGVIMPYLLAERGKAAVIYPVSSWKLKEYVKKPGISSIVTDLKPTVDTNADLYNIFANTSGSLKVGAVVTLDSGHPYDGKKRGDPSHTLVYGGELGWLDNRTNVQIYSNIFHGAKETTPEGLKKRFASLAGGSLSDSDIARLSSEGSWIAKGSHFIARESGHYVIYNPEKQYVSFKQEGAAPLPQSAAALKSAIGDPYAIVSEADVKKIRALPDGECCLVQREIGNRFLFSSRDADARQKSIALFGYDVFAAFQPNQLVDEPAGKDGLEYSVRREKDPSGKYGEVNVYAPTSSAVYYIIRKEGGSVSISSKRSEFMKGFGWTMNSGLYAVDFSKMPPSRDRMISSRDFGLEKVTAEGFASLLSKSYGVMFEYALNEIMKQNSVPSARAPVRSLDVQIAVMVPDAVLGRLLNSPIEMVETPTEKKFWKEYEDLKNQSSPAQYTLLSQLTERRDEYFRKCAQIDNSAQKMGVQAINISALKVIMFNEMYGSPNKLSWYTNRLYKHEAKEYSSDREAQKSLKHSLGLEFDLSWAPGWTGVPWLGKKLKLAPLKSWGYFQQNIDYVQRYLDGYPKSMLYYEGKKDLSNRKASQDRRNDLISRIKGTEGSEKAAIKLRIWERLGEGERRDAVMDMLGGSVPFALHMANILFLQNKANFEDQAWHHAGRNYTSTDLEMTTVFSYNRGMGRGNLTIFQQNLLIAAQNMMKTAKGAQAQQFAGAMKGFYVSGSVTNAAGEEKTLQLFRAVCMAKGITSVKFGSGTYAASEITSAILDRELVRSSVRYRNAFSFFSMPQFGPADFATQAEPGNASPYPTLKYSYFSSKQAEKYLTPYVASYLFFAEPAEKAGENGPILKQEISAKGVKKCVVVDYTVPTYPGLVSLNVFSQDGKLAYSFLDAARQTSGHYKLATTPLPRGFYRAELKVGDKKLQKIVYVAEAKD